MSETSWHPGEFSWAKEFIRVLKLHKLYKAFNNLGSFVYVIDINNLHVIVSNRKVQKVCYSCTMEKFKIETQKRWP